MRDIMLNELHKSGENDVWEGRNFGHFPEFNTRENVQNLEGAQKSDLGRVKLSSHTRIVQLRAHWNGRKHLLRTIRKENKSSMCKTFLSICRIEMEESNRRDEERN
ncbi:hypothetical protein L6164_018247 [Bauhinia variegata]|uniref:Uncharacterized protein n=1 Tax=Bauhinia variegata TaxID=167791 RepID=A0ACB9NAK5_BAUVA|nr:hypothetical protein L6164_018247 [Bauhinia variegata]